MSERTHGNEDSGRRAGRALGALATLIVLALTSLLVPFAPRVDAAEPVLPDGLTSFTAAASCWEIKQDRPTAADGLYWLVTPALQAPDQYYCDMTTDGGGWVLVGRGREGWRTNYEGLGRAAEVRDVVDGPGAFIPRQLGSRTIDGLLNGQRVDSLADGIRLRRATTTDGSVRQEVRFKLQTRDRWVWTFGAEHVVGPWSFGTTSSDIGSGGQTNSFGNNTALRRVDFRATSAQGFTHGWAFGTSTTGTNASTSYLWSATNGAGSARPFTQVFLRPQLRRADLAFPPIPAGGTPQQELTPLLGSGALPAQWGVSGLANGRSTELTTEVAAFAQIGTRVYVGGNFRWVQRGEGATGADLVDQSYLAAFDVATGDWVPGFRPTFNEQVKSLKALPDGTLMVGGDFTQANGQPATGIARLDATTGATAPGWKVSIENRLPNGVVSIRALDVQGGWLYLGGTLTHLTGGTWTTPVYSKMAARVSVSTGIPDNGWNPNLNGGVLDLDASADGSRVYVAGYFTSAGGVSAVKAAVLNTTNGGLAGPSWAPVWSAAANYQQAILEVGDRLWVGGSEHSLFSFDRTTLNRLSGNITKSGGDFQSIGTSAGVVYATCHCNEWNYESAFTWSNVGTSWTQADKIGYIGAWDAATGRTIPDFNPVMQGRIGYGPWETFADSLGNVWFGGDMSRAVRADGVAQWVGGFVRFAPRDTVAPTSPSGLSTTSVDTTSVSLSWTGSTGGPLSYEVLVDGRVVAVTTQTSLTMPSPSGTASVAVRAVDTIGNRSASTPPISVTPPPPGSTEVFVASASTWRWRFAGAWPAGWTTAGFDDAAWSQGPAPLGFGATGLGTNIDVAGGSSNRPLSAQFRQRFEVTDRASLTGVTISAIADDGVVVWVNGVEVGRANMPSGTLSAGSYPTSAPRTTAARSNPVTFVVPPSLLQDGTNVVAASTHLGWKATPDVSFDLQMTGLRGSPDVTPPPSPAPTASLLDATTVQLSWPAVDDGGAAVTAYRVLRNGAEVAFLPGTQTAFTDAGLPGSTSFTYDVTAVDSIGNESAPGSVTIATAADPFLLRWGSTWRWYYQTAAPPADWRDQAFVDASWSQGPGKLGFGTTGLGTDISGPSPRPLAAYFRSTIDVADPAVLSGLQLTTIADDGVIVFVNGVEVGRSNLPAGTITHNSSYALSGPSSASAAANPVTFTVPASLLQAGVNQISAQVQLGWRTTPNISFDAQVVAQPL